MLPIDRRIAALAALAVAALAVGCVGEKEEQAMARTFEAAGRRPDQTPQMLNQRPPFEYPRDLLARKVQGNVLLRLHVDSTGGVVPESTTIVESAGVAELDSAARRGVPKLRFRPALRDRQPIAASFLFPVFFRAPGAPPLPGDTILEMYERQRRQPPTP